MRRYALRGILAHKRRLLSTVTAVLLGVAFMAGSLVFTDTMKASLSGAFQDGERSTDVLVRGPVTITTGQGTQHAPVPAGLAADLAAVDGVAAVAPRLEGFAQVLGTDGKPVDDLSGGAAPSGAAWAADERLNPFELVAGRAPRGADEVVVDRSTADAADLSVGDRTSVLTGAAPQEMTVVGIATFAGQDNRAGNRTVLFSAATADRLLGGDGRVDGIALLVGAFIISNTFSILVAQRTRELALLRAIGASARQVRRSVVLEALVVGAVASALGLFAGVGVARGIQALWSVLGITMPDGPLVVSSRSLVISFVVGVVVTVASALLPARRAARVAPVAAMRAVAVEPVRVSRRRAVIGLVLTAISAASVVLGILDGVVPLVLLGALGALFGVATLAPLLARPVVRLLAALLPRLVGIRGLLARENAVRNPRRTAATASALMIGVALVGSITSFAASGKHSVTASFDQEFRGDLVVESGAWVFGGVSPELSTALRAQPEVAVAVPRQFTQARVGDSSAEVTGWSAGLEKVFDVGRTAGSAPTLGADGVALGTSYARSHDLSLGDSVTITTASGASRSLTVRQLFRHTDWAGAVVVDRATFAALQPGALDTSVYVKGAEGVGAGALRAAVDRVAAPYANADVRDRDEMRAAVASDFNAILGIVFGLLALAIVIALLGIANTVALSVVERTRELGLLRAVGMGRGHLRGMVRWEAALIAVFDTVTGLAVGMFLGWAMVFAVSQQVETAEFVVPYGQLGVIVAIAAVCGVVAALLPARRAARLDVLAAIATD